MVKKDKTSDLKALRRKLGDKLAAAPPAPPPAVGSPCPACKVGTVVGRMNRTTGQSFHGCSQYYDGCRWTHADPVPGPGDERLAGKDLPTDARSARALERIADALEELLIHRGVHPNDD